MLFSFHYADSIKMMDSNYKNVKENKLKIQKCTQFLQESNDITSTDSATATITTNPNNENNVTNDDNKSRNQYNNNDDDDKNNNDDDNNEDDDNNSSNDNNNDINKDNNTNNDTNKINNNSRYNNIKRLDSTTSWLVCMCVVLTNSIVFGSMYIYGIFFPHILKEFQESKSRTGTINAPFAASNTSPIFDVVYYNDSENEKNAISFHLWVVLILCELRWMRLCYTYFIKQNSFSIAKKFLA